MADSNTGHCFSRKIATTEEHWEDRLGCRGNNQAQKGISLSRSAFIYLFSVFTALEPCTIFAVQLWPTQCESTWNGITHLRTLWTAQSGLWVHAVFLWFVYCLGCSMFSLPLEVMCWSITGPSLAVWKAQGGIRSPWRVSYAMLLVLCTQWVLDEQDY